MKINSDKTALLWIASQQQHQLNPPELVQLTILDVDGNPIKPNRTLGANSTRDLTWGSHLFKGEKAIMPNIKKILGPLWIVSKHLYKN